MSRASKTLLVFFLALPPLCGCAALVGDFTVGTQTGDLDAGDSTTTESSANPGLEAGPLDATATNDVLGDHGDETAPGADALSDGPDESTAVGDALAGDAGACTPQAARCSGSNVQTCDTNGSWSAPAACPSAKPFCNGAGICGVCADSTTQCSGGGGVQTCIAGAWGTPAPCMNQTCSMGVCAGSCQPNATQCSGNGVQKCDATAHWAPPTACVNQTCVSGACQGVCAPSDTNCSPGGVQACDPTGAWATATPCGLHQSCTGGGSAGPAVCTCKVDPTCKAAGLTCASTTTLDVCAQDSQACWYASSTSMCSNGACFGSPGSATCCTNACTAGSTQCGGAGLQTCQVQGNGCTAWNAGAACGPHQSCTGSPGSASCTCIADPVCAAVGTVCADPMSTATCAQDAQNCFYRVSSMACGANKNCAGGSCVCNGGYTPCSGSCVLISSDNNNCGACGHVCPVLSSPSSGSTCVASTCTGYVGGYVQTGAGPLLSNPDGSTVFAIQATMPAVAGTFQGIGGIVGSNDPSPATTQMVYGLYSDSGGTPGTLLFYTPLPDTGLSFADPSPLITVRTSGGVYGGGFNNALAANTTYWIYMKAGTNSNTGNIAGVSSGPCLGAHWINTTPPGSFLAQGARSCPGDFAAYMIVSFP